MIVLPAAGSMDHQQHSQQTPSKIAIMRGNHRRKRSKGTIAGFASGKDGISSLGSVESSNDHDSLMSRKGVSLSLSSSMLSSVQLNSSEGALPLLKSSTYARMALLCTQNAIRLGARTQLNLCPPGRVRRELQAALRQRTRVQQQQMQNMSTRNKIRYASEGYFGLDKFLGAGTLEDYEAQEEDFLMNTNTFEVDSDEEASSGDEDDMCDLDDIFSENPKPLDDHEKYMKMREPLYAPFGSEPGGNNGPGISSSANSSGKLPFNRRKVRYFDLVTAEETSSVREYLRKEAIRANKRASLILKRHLRRGQLLERQRKQLENGETVDDMNDFDHIDPDEAEILDSGVSKFEHLMTPAMSASFLNEILIMNSRESIEGMAKCYDGIVAAGVAILDAMTVDPTSPPSADGKNRPSRAAIMSALAPLLITTLDQPSGDVIRMLAKLRRLCATDRYRRRFVQRIAPCLIRPPDGAMWCLRHQNDMHAILAAAELIFDSAFDVFSKGWYERGQLLLADTKRAATLSSAAEQLRNLSSEPPDGLARGLSVHTNRRRVTPKEATTNEPLAEWEVIAVDKQIRISISHILSTDWTIATVNDVPIPQYRRSVSAGRRSQPTLELSPRGLLSSPSRVPTAFMKPPNSPPSMPSFGNFQSSGGTDNIMFLHDHDKTPPPPSLQPLSVPLSTNIPDQKRDRNGGKSPTDLFTTTAPPKSPKSPIKASSDVLKEHQNSTSPKRIRKDFPNTQSTITSPPSPLANTVGTNVTGDITSLKPSVAAPPVSTVAGTTSHYRMLTSTAAERKRTVAACRALRAQIQRFEDAFIQLHGRPPKGASDRAPLATTYAQYREWKRAIRADAACRIQALFRGARSRWHLLRSNNVGITKVILKGAGRTGYASSDTGSQASVTTDVVSLELESTSSLSVSTKGDSVAGLHQTVESSWPNQGTRRRSANEAIPTSAVMKPFSPATSVQHDGASLSFAELQTRKRELKQQLKQYDMNFARKHGRMPVKAEKEPIRHLYEAYNSLKHQISLAEQESRNQPASSPSPIPSTLPQRVPSPQPLPEIIPSNNESEPATSKASPLPARGKRKVPKAVAPPIASTSSSTGATPPVSNASNSTDLAALKAEKSTLHQMLRAYEKDFFKEHRRQVSSFADIRPVASQYRRYKDIKKAIAALQQGGH